MPLLLPLPTRVRPRRWGLRALHLALCRALPLGLPLALVLALGCGGDHLTPPPPADPAVLFWNLELNHRAVTLSTTEPYDTLTLRATPQNYAGEPLAGAPTPEYTTSNESQVLVTPAGVLVAVKPTDYYDPVRVIAKLTVGGVTHWDTVYVKVVDNPTPPVLASLSIQPIPPDSAKRGIYAHSTGPIVKPDASGGILLLSPLRMIDTAGQPVTDIVVGYDVSDLKMATPEIPDLTSYYPNLYAGNGDDGLQFAFTTLRTSRPGTVTFYASATAFGVTKADTLPFQLGWPLGIVLTTVPDPSRGPGNFFFHGHLSPSIEGVTIGAGGVVGWRTRHTGTGKPTPFATEIVFDDPTNVRPLNDAAHLLYPFHYPAMCSGSVNGDPVPGAFDGCSTGGNIVLPADSLTGAYRVFPVPGTYEYRNALNGARSRIVVMP